MTDPTPQPTGRRGLLIVNLGSPKTPDQADISSFLASFLSDRRVVHWPRVVWLPILHGIVRRVRPARVRENYLKIWQFDESPLTHYTIIQRDRLAQALPEVSVKYAMVYTEPSIAECLREFAREQVTDLTVIPLYPQYAPSTVAPIFDQVYRHYLGENDMPTLHLISRFEQHPIYVDWYARKLAEACVKSAVPVERIVFSFHGVPRHERHLPDEYRRSCHDTAEAICAHPELAKLGIDYQVTFQSKFGPGEWLTPATIDEMGQLPRRYKVRSIVVCTPGFISDCIETLDEINILNRETFMAAGGESFTYVHPLNDDDAVIDLLVDLYRTAGR